MATDIYGRYLDVICYIEGYKIPIMSVNISTQLGMPSIATITVPPVATEYDLKYSTHIVLFYRLSSMREATPIRSQYKLMFHGEVTGVKLSRNGVNMSMQINAVDSRTYLNRLPNRMLWAMFNDSSGFFPNYIEDAAYYGIPKKDAINSYLTSGGIGGVFMEKTKYSLVTYMNKIFDLFKYDKGAYVYYHNAAKRFYLRENHHFIDYGNTFKELWGALYKSSLLKNITQSMAEHQGTTMDSLVGNIRPMGYVYSSTIFPKHMGNKLGEYFIMRDMINHRVPKFNYVVVDRDDNFDAIIAPPPVTAIKYKYKIGESTYPINNEVFPREAMGNVKTGPMKLTAGEKLYGINRESIDMEYFYNAFLKDMGEGKSGYYKEGERAQGLGKKTEYDFIVKQTSRNGLSIAKVGLYPQWVLGLPMALHDPLTGRSYMGIFSRIAYSVNLDTGSCSTTAEAQNVILMDNVSELDRERTDTNPHGRAEFIAAAEAFYGEYFYPKAQINDTYLTSLVIGNMGLKDYYSYIERPTCTMHQYLSMYSDIVDPRGGIPEDLMEMYKDESGDPGRSDIVYPTFTENSDYAIAAAPRNATKKMRINGLFIGERRDIAMDLYNKLKKRVLHE